jgi:hypothetical protein
MVDDYAKELDELLRTGTEIAGRVLTAPENTRKYKPYSYKQKSLLEHITRAQRHFESYRLQLMGADPQSEENHLHNGFARIIMAIQLEQEGK